MNITQDSKRIWELDFMRGIALLLMVYFHMIYSLNEFSAYTIQYSSGLTFYIGRVSGILFILISGISATLGRNHIQRGLKLLAIAFAITLVSRLYNPEYVIKFGILHFLGSSMLLTPVMMKIHKVYLMPSSIVLILAGNRMSALNVSAGYLFPLGLTNGQFSSADYYPLLPWLGVFLIGLFLGRTLYSARYSRLPFGLHNHPITKIGRKTLPIYLIHQPVILVLLLILDYLR